MIRLWIAGILLGLAAGPAVAAEPDLVRLTIIPSPIVLDRPQATQRVLVTGITKDGAEFDLTDRVTFQLDGTAARLEAGGTIASLRNGTARLTARLPGSATRAATEVRVSAAGATFPWSFTSHVAPLLARTGCGSVACHGSAQGKGGFRLSAFGSSAEQDFRAISREGGGRRIHRARPGLSLLLLKATATLPHGGGIRFGVSSPEYRLLARWVASGAPWGEAVRPVRLEVQPADRLLTRAGQAQRMLVTAHYPDGTREDVTSLSQFESRNEEAVRATGSLLRAAGCGEAPVLVRYAGTLASVSVGATTGPRSPAGEVPGGMIDREIFGRLARLRVRTAPAAPSHELVRRLYLDLVGRIPTSDELRSLSLNEQTPLTPEQVGTLVDRLLSGPEYVRHWRNVLHAHLMGRDSQPAGPWAAWLEKSLREDAGWDGLVRKMLVARPAGDADPDAAAALFLDRRFVEANTGLDQATRDVSRLFFGVDIQCARCHAHPAVPAWKQDAYWGIASFFARTYRIQVKGKFHLAEKATGEADYFGPDKEKLQARPQLLSLAALPAEPAASEAVDSYLVPPEEAKEKTRVPRPRFSRRERFAEVAVSGDDPFFARAMVNRVWATLMGHGLVDPVEQLHAGNPPTHPALLDGLTREFVGNGFRLRGLIRSVVISRAYALTSNWTVARRPAPDLYAVAPLRALEMQPLAESLLVAAGHWDQAARKLSSTTTPAAEAVRAELEKATAAQQAELRRRLDTGTETFQAGVTQALYLANNGEFYKLVREGELVKRLADLPDDDACAREAFLAVLSRPPSKEEAAAFAAYLQPRRERRPAAVAQAVWALLASTEFRFNH